MIDPLIRHQAFIQRLAGGIYKRVLPLLLATSVEARQLIGNESDLIAVLRKQPELEAIIRRSHDEFSQSAFAELDDFARYEAEFSQRLLQGLVTARVVGLDSRRLEAIVRETVLQLVSGDNVRRVTLPQLFQEFAANKAGEVRRVVSAGVLRGVTTQQLGREIDALVNNRTRNQALALVRTATNHIGNQARQQLFEANADILAGERFLATLDARTTLTCSSNDGKVFPVGEGLIPPLHFGCRSVRLPLIKDEYRIMGAGQRAAAGEAVDARTTYSGWLRKQPNDVQNEILGVERAKLFRANKVALERFTDDRGVVYTLDELRQREGLTLQ